MRRFLTLEKALWYKGEFEALDAVIQEYFQLKHAEPVPIKDLDKTLSQVYDALTGTEDRQEAIRLQQQLQSLFEKGGFLLRKWQSNDSSVLEHVSSDLKDLRTTHSITSQEHYTKTLGIEWNPS